MKKAIKFLSSIFIGLIAIALIGCDNPQSSKSQVALAMCVGAHSNNNEIPINSNTVKNLLYNTCYTYGDVSLITVEGTPKLIYNCKIPRPDVNGLSENKLKTIAQEYVVQLQGAMASIEASSPEVDTLKAIRMAADCLNASDSETTDKVLCILDSGISTTGYVQFQNGLLNADPKDIVAALNEVKAIPDLAGISVLWAYCGETAQPQNELTPAEKERLKEIWTAVLLDGGAKQIEFTTDLSSSIPYQDLPEVTIVDVNEECIDIDIPANTEPLNITEEPIIRTVILDGTCVQFVGDQAVFVDREMARESIKQIANQMLLCSNKVYVAGTTASGETSFCQMLSEARAKAVVEVLTEMGVSEDRMIPIGLGCTDPWHVDDMENGILIENEAALNRKVLIIDIESEDAKLINNYER